MSVADSQEFREIYSEALIYGFSALGKHLGKIVSDYLSRKYGISTIETYKNPKLLHEALEKSLGYGAILVETRIVKTLRSSLSMNQKTEQPKIRIGHPEDFEKYIYESLREAENRKISNNNRISSRTFIP